MLRANRIWPTRNINQLANSLNPYLKSHADNPVHWKLWNEKTLELAKKLNRPIFLSVGYHSCHWCHVMNKESFSNQEIAQELNENFVPIKIDKEEWPDLDGIYMMYLQATTGSGGWPLNVFLTPDLKPIFGGTYWAGPDVSERQLSTLNAIPFSNVMKAIQRQWTENHDECVEHANLIASKLSTLVSSKTSEPVDLDPAQVTADAESRLLDTFDSQYGGYGDAPKFPLAATLKFGIQSSQPDVRASAITTLSNIYGGGIKDQIGYGIARYSVAADWHLPHFEKMLCDQALILDVALEDPATHDLANDLTDFLVKGPLRSSKGWYSAVDADSPNSSGVSQEGEYYCWTYRDFDAALKGMPLFDIDICAMYFGVNENGNISQDLDPHGEFYHKNVLSTYKTIKEVAQTFGRSENNVAEIIVKGKQKLLQWRTENKRAPEIDGKVVTGWNGAAIGALARAYQVLGRRDALSAAIDGVNALHDNNWKGELYRTTDGNVPAVNDDYAYVIGGLLDIYEATFNPQYMNWALELQKQQIEKFWDPRGGFFTSQDLNWLLFRPKTAFDSAEPSSNGISLRNLWRLASMQSNIDYVHKCQQMVDAYSADIALQPTGYLSMLRTINGLKSPKCIAIIGDDEQIAAALIDSARHQASKKHLPIIRVNKNSVHLFPKFKQLWTDTEGAELVLVDAE